MKIVIIGAGKLGYKLAESLSNSDIDITIIDSNPKVIERIREYLDVLAITANGVDLNSLISLNIKSYDLLIATTQNDETNTIICVLAKKAGCKTTIARIRNPEYSQQTDFLKNEMGIDHIVNPELSTSNEMLRYLLKHYIPSAGSFAMGKVSMIDSPASNFKDFPGNKIMDLKSIDDYIIVAISRDGNVIIPNGSTMILPSDILYIIGKSPTVSKLIDRHNLIVNKSTVKNVMILGGGKIGYYLATRLIAHHIHVTIIEADNERCRYLSEKLDNALIINGDGADIKLLEEESLSSMDAFIGCTGLDEQNLLMALMAKQAGVKKTIAKVSRQNYTQIIDKLDIDIALNPTDIISNNILKYIHGGKVASVSLLLGGQAEVMEIIVSSDFLICGKKVCDLGLPKGVIIGAIVDKGTVMIPNGQTIIQDENRLIVFCLAENIPSVDSMLKTGKRGFFR